MDEERVFSLSYEQLTRIAEKNIRECGLDSQSARCLNEPRQPGGCKLKTAPVRPVVAARPAEYVCSEDLFY
ncbi:hypothetical protein ACRFKX_22485 [Escherichia coli]|uniref:hypothetical protein n=1 Tax=Escherichia coli TaxID=562 RepID=UPI003D6D314A